MKLSILVVLALLPMLFRGAQAGEPKMDEPVTLTRGDVAAIICMAAGSATYTFSYDPKADTVTVTVMADDPAKNPRFAASNLALRRGHAETKVAAVLPLLQRLVSPTMKVAYAEKVWGQ
jgi:hypothetical protein